MTKALEPLRSSVFRRLLLSYTLNEIGDVVGLVALALLVYKSTHSAISTASLYVALNLGPAVVAPLVVARLDTFALKRVLPAVYLIEACIFTAMSFVSDHFSLAVVLALGALDGALAVTARALTRAAVARVLDDGERLRRGNALLNFSFSAAGVSGAAIGGLLVGSLGTASALLVDATSFLLIAVILLGGGVLPVANPEAPTPFREAVRSGLRFLKASPGLRLVVGGEALALLFFTLVVPVEVVYARETLHTSASGFGVLLSAWSIGMVAGSLVFVFAKSRLRVAVVLSTFLVGAGYLGMALVGSLTSACLFSILGGFGNGIQWISVITLLQQSVPAELQARVMGLMESLNRGVPAIGFLIGGALTSLLSATAAFAAAGVGVMVLSVAGAISGVLVDRRPALVPVPGSDGQH